MNANTPVDPATAAAPQMLAVLEEARQMFVDLTHLYKVGGPREMIAKIDAVVAKATGAK